RLRVAVLAPGGRTVTEEGPAAKILPRCGYCRPMHTVAVIALPDVIAFDLTTAVEVFGRVVLPSGEPGYRVRVCGTQPVVSAGPMRIATEHAISEVDGVDTIVVPGRND